MTGYSRSKARWARTDSSGGSGDDNGQRPGHHLDRDRRAPDVLAVRPYGLVGLVSIFTLAACRW